MKKRLPLTFILAASLLMTACVSNTKNTQNTESQSMATNMSESQSTESEVAESPESESELSGGQREIKGVNGETITLPPAKDIKRVVIMAPIAFPSVLNVIPDRDMFVGVHSVSFTTSEEEILNKTFPKWESVETAFLDNEGYNANIEELIKLEPDIIFYDAQWQSEGLDKLDIPLIDINMKEDNNNAEKMTLTYEKVFKDIFGVESENILQTKWDSVNAKVAEIVNQSEAPKTVLFIWQNMDDHVSVYGKNTYVEEYCNKVNLKNVADEVEGFPEVSMEQIYQWDPDYIFMLKGFGGDNHAQKILSGEDAKDWSRLKAFKNKTFYDVPKTLLGWISPSTDSPLMVYWLLNKLYPEQLSDEELEKIVEEHYQSLHKVELEPELIRTILSN